jgi:hypothetical protein
LSQPVVVEGERLAREQLLELPHVFAARAVDELDIRVDGIRLGAQSADLGQQFEK